MTGEQVAELDGDEGVNLTLTDRERGALGLPLGRPTLRDERGEDGELTARALAARLAEQGW